MPILIQIICVLAQAGPSLTVNVQDNAVIGNVLAVMAQPISESGVNRVEFSVDDQLRLTVSKPPYEYKWDTIDEEEGRHTLIVAVFDGDGRTGKKRIKVEVDNGLSQGVKPHAERAIAALRKGELDTCYYEGRKAYRVSMSDMDAIRAMAASVGSKGDLNRAIDMLEKPVRVNNVNLGDPKLFPLTDKTALELRGYFRLRRAATKPNEASVADLGATYDFAAKVSQLELAEIRAKHPEPFKTIEDRLAVADALMDRGEFEPALAIYRGASFTGKEALLMDNRIALALLRLNRTREAELMLVEMTGSGKADDSTRAILGEMYLLQRKYAKAHAEVEKGVEHHAMPALIVAAHASLGMKDYRRGFEELKEAAAIARADISPPHSTRMHGISNSPQTTRSNPSSAIRFCSTPMPCGHINSSLWSRPRESIRAYCSST